MEITYKRSLQKSYMYVKQPEGKFPKHELMMLQNYRIPCVLPMNVIMLDGAEIYAYDISGKQQVFDYLSGRKLGREELCRMLFSLQKVCSSVPEYLLREEGICLGEEFVYTDLEDGSLNFAYQPFGSENLFRSFHRWMEQILKQVDHQDHEAVELAYAVYQETLQEGVTIHNLLQKAMQDGGGEGKKEIWEKPEKEEERIIEEENSRDRSRKENTGMEEMEVEKADKQFGCHFELPGKEKLLEWVKNLVSEKLPRLESLEEILKRNRKMKRETGNGGNYRPVFMPGQVEEEEKKQQHPTVYLGKTTQGPQGRLIYQGIHGQSDFNIGQKSFLIGKSEEQVDGIMDAEGISRLHAKIQYKEGDYYLEDLNSTNGTFLNGEPLEYHQVKKLGKSDRVRFAEEEYVFC